MRSTVRSRAGRTLMALGVFAMVLAALLGPTSARAAEIIVDNGDPGFSTDSSWTSSTGTAGAYNGNYLHDGSSAADPSRWARWQPNIPAAGQYLIYMRWTAHANRADAAPITIGYNGGIDTSKTVNQTTNNNTWVLLGSYDLAAGTGNYLQISASDAGYTVADAVRFVSAPATSVTLPTFAFDRILFKPSDLIYNPTDEIIFPSVLHAAEHFANPLGEYYLYYAPHDSPGGISLAYSNTPEGPWTEYANNPLISNEWTPHYDVNHVSSPHAIWNYDENQLFLYFHGDNNVTRLATSTDGVSFTYAGEMVDTTDFTGISEASYARVFEYTIPSKGNKYIMLLMGNNGGVRKIYLATSSDGRSWTAQPTPLISPNTEEGANIAAPAYFPWQGEHYVIYHGSSGNMHITRVGANFDQEEHLGVFFDDPVKRAASASIITVNNVMYMFYERGPRLDGEIALAKAVAPQTSFEVETLNNNNSGDLHEVFLDPQMTGGQGAKYNANAISDFVTYTVPVPQTATYEVRVRVKAQNTRGIYQLSIGTANLGSPQNFYAGGNTYQERVIGTVNLAAGNTAFTFTVTGKHSSSIGYTLGLDYIKLVPLP